MFFDLKVSSPPFSREHCAVGEWSGASHRFQTGFFPAVFGLGVSDRLDIGVGRYQIIKSAEEGPPPPPPQPSLAPVSGNQVTGTAAAAPASAPATVSPPANAPASSPLDIVAELQQVCLLPLFAVMVSCPALM